MKYIRNSNGFSIVEVAAGLVILAIILMSFMGILVQTKKTNASSETIQDATYVAQAEMEALYLIANSTNSLDKLAMPELLVNGRKYEKKNQLNALYKECKEITSGQITNTILYTAQVNEYTSNLKFDLTCRPNNNVLGSVTLELIDPKSGSTKAKLENAYIWK